MKIPADPKAIQEAQEAEMRRASITAELLDLHSRLNASCAKLEEDDLIIESLSHRRNQLASEIEFIKQRIQELKQEKCTM